MSAFQPQAPYASIEDEFEERTRRAFVDGHADYVLIDSRRQRFQIEMIAYCRRRGWLDDGELYEHDEQSTEYRFRLTPAGNAHFGIDRTEKNKP